MTDPLNYYIQEFIKVALHNAGSVNKAYAIMQSAFIINIIINNHHLYSAFSKKDESAVQSIKYKSKSKNNVHKYVIQKQHGIPSYFYGHLCFY